MSAERPSPGPHPDLATAETLLRLVETSGEWLRRMERDTMLMIALLAMAPLVAFGSAVAGPAKIAFLGDLIVPGVVIGAVCIVVLFAVLVRRYLRIRKEVGSWEARLEALRVNLDGLLSRL